MNIILNIFFVLPQTKVKKFAAWKRNYIVWTCSINSSAVLSNVKISSAHQCNFHQFGIYLLHFRWTIGIWAFSIHRFYKPLRMGCLWKKARVWTDGKAKPGLLPWLLASWLALNPHPLRFLTFWEVLPLPYRNLAFLLYPAVNKNAIRKSPSHSIYIYIYRYIQIKGSLVAQEESG